MELQTKAALRVRTPRVKSISDADGHPEILVCLFTGEIRLYDKDTLRLTRSAQIGDVPIRTGVIVPSMDWILVGTDAGCIVVVDLGNLSVVSQVLAHDDFVRKIVLDEKNMRFITVSDDNTAKLWSLGRTISLINRYKGKHFIMDACFCPSDRSLFLTASLDAKVHLYSVEHEKPLRVFRGHEKGVNAITFVGPDTFATGADDNTVIIWDYKRGAQITRLRGHTGNINCVRRMRGGFASCSEDSTVRFWSDDFKTVDIRNLAGRVWAVLERDGKVFAGSDEELVVFEEQRAERMAAMAGGRIFYNEGCLLRMIRLEEPVAGALPTREGLIRDLGASKDLGTLEDGFVRLSASASGKLVAVSYPEHFTLFSTLGLRKKLTLAGGDVVLGGGDSFVFRAGESVVAYRGLEEESVQRVAGMETLLLADRDILVLNRRHTCAVDRAALAGGADEDSYVLHEFDVRARRAFCFGELLVLLTDKLLVYSASFNCVGAFDHAVLSFCVRDDVLFLSTQHHSFYCIAAGESLHMFPMRHVENILGARGDDVFFLGASPMAFRTDGPFVEFQRGVLRGRPTAVDDEIVDKAISFYETLGQHERALELCRNEYQKFEILLKLGRLDEAFRLANSPIKYRKLGRAYLGRGMLGPAAECFYRSDDLNSLLFVDVFAGRKYLAHVGAAAAQRGMQNLAFMAHFKGGNYAECSSLLRGTPFHRAFSQSYCAGE